MEFRRHLAARLCVWHRRPVLLAAACLFLVIVLVNAVYLR